jgi:hypothetical protein
MSNCLFFIAHRRFKKTALVYGELDIVIEIKKGRLRWLGHVEGMSEESVVKRLYQNTPEGSRNVGRPRLRWMDDVREDMRMGVTNWRIRAHRRDDWKTVVKETKVLQGLYSQGE